MFQLTKNLAQLVASRRRPELQADYGFLQDRQTNIQAALRLGSDTLFGLIDTHAEIAAALLYAEIDPTRKAQISRGYYDEQPMVLHHLADALSRTQGKLGEAGAAAFGGVTPDLLNGIALREELYARIREEAQAGAGHALDLSLELDAYAWFCVRTVVEVLVETLDDPTLPEDEREALLLGFKDLLRYQDLVLRSRAESREQTEQAARDAAARLEQARKDELLTEVEYAVRRGQPVDPEMLDEAAQWWQERKNKGGDSDKDPTRKEGRQARR